jgi:SAM-dependent methyltransferase
LKVSHLEEHYSLLSRNIYAAETILPFLCEWLTLRSVLDVGCGIGVWMKIFARDAGAEVLGIDIEELPQSQLLVEKSLILNLDIAAPFDLGRHFDLVLCLETAEHIETEHSSALIESLGRHGNVILFSAALPGQIGLHHINEQLPEFWIERFTRIGFNLHDILRPRIWTDQRIPTWYRQNMLLFSRDGSPQDKRLRSIPAPRLVSIAHPDLLHSHGTEVTRLAAAAKTGAIRSQQEVEKLQAVLVQAVRRNEAIIAQKDEAIRRNEAIIAQKDEAIRRKEAIIAQKEEIEHRYRAAVGEAEALQRIIEAIRKSVSWRASMPVRAAGRVVRMLAGQPWRETDSLTAFNLKRYIPDLSPDLSQVAALLPVEIRSADKEILTRLPFFDPNEYLKVNPDVAHAGVDPLEHYWNSGRAECRSFISSIGAARAVTHYNHCDDATVRFPYLDRAPTPEVSLWTHLRVALLTGSRGNYYMDEIADHVGHGLMDLGVTAIRNNETFQDLDAVDYVIIIAPHEFFSPATPEFWKTALSSPKVSVLNTEQLQTPYFARSLPHILQAGKVIDLNYQMAAMFQDAGLDTLYYLPGYVESSTSYPQSPELPRHPLTESLPKAVWDYSLDRDEFASRPIDITFIGKVSPIRNEFLARNNSFLASRLCQIIYRQRNDPMPLGSFTAEMPRVTSAIARRSKIVLNIHRNGIGYFEWMRIVCQGIWQKAAVVSNRCLAHPIFKPNEHFFEESLSRIPKLLAWLLDTEEGRAEADRVRRAAFETLVQHCPLRASTVALLGFLQREPNCQPRGPISPVRAIRT